MSIENPSYITGTITYRERVRLRPAFRLTVRLQDVSRADAPAILLGEDSYRVADRQVPLPFAIPYDPEAIDPRFTYSVSARIEDGRGKLRFISDTVCPVITRGNPVADIEIIVRGV
jgi:putative lipoprotein